MKYKITKILYFKIKKPSKTEKILRLVSKAQDIMRYLKMHCDVLPNRVSELFTTCNEI